MHFEFVYIYRHIYRKWLFLLDSKCWNTVILSGLTYTSSWKVFHDGRSKKGTFPIKILNKNSLSLAHCTLNRSYTVSGHILLKKLIGIKHKNLLFSKQSFEGLKIPP